MKSNLTHKIAPKRAQNCDKKKFYKKTAYVQSQQFTQALPIYTSSAQQSHDILHVWSHHWEFYHYD